MRKSGGECNWILWDYISVRFFAYLCILWSSTRATINMIEVCAVQSPPANLHQVLSEL